jgi:hypothetical protein
VVGSTNEMGDDGVFQKGGISLRLKDVLGC